METVDVCWELHDTDMEQGDGGMPSKPIKPMERLGRETGMQGTRCQVQCSNGHLVKEVMMTPALHGAHGAPLPQGLCICHSSSRPFASIHPKVSVTHPLEFLCCLHHHRKTLYESLYLVQVQRDPFQKGPRIRNSDPYIIRMWERGKPTCKLH